MTARPYGRVGDVVPEHTTLADLVEAGYTLGDALQIRAFSLYLAHPRHELAQLWAVGELDARQLLEQVAPHELKAAS